MSKLHFFFLSCSQFFSKIKRTSRIFDPCRYICIINSLLHSAQYSLLLGFSFTSLLIRLWAFEMLSTSHCFVCCFVVSPYDTPFSRMDIPLNIYDPITPLHPDRFSSLGRLPKTSPSIIGHYDRGHHSAASDRGGYSCYPQHSIVTLPVKEDVSWFIAGNSSLHLYIC